MTVSVAGSAIKKRLIAIGNNDFWYENIDVAAGTFIELDTSSGAVDTTKQIWAFELYGKSLVENGAIKKVADFVNVKITTSDVVPGGAGVAPPDFGTVLEGQTSHAKMIVDYITALDSTCTIYGRRTTTATFSAGETVTGTDDDGNGISFTTTVEVAGPFWYTWTPFGNNSTFGSLPDQVTLGAAWNGRAVIAGNEDDPNQWYMSRQGNPWDWNYIADDPQAPVSGEDADAGKVGDTIVALIPYSKDYFIFGCANSLWYLAGNPAAHGSLLSLDDTGGILDSQAWCKDKEDNLYILATTGLLKIPNGFGQPQNLLEIIYPDFIKDLDFDGSLHRVILGFDKNRNGIKIIKTTLASGANSNWWYDLRTGGLFPETYPNQCGVYCMFDYAATDAGYSGLIHGCKDGYARVEVDTAKDDDIGVTDQAIDSYVTFGPIEIAGENREGKITSIVGETVGGAASGSEADSNNLTYKAWSGLSSDVVVEKLIANTTPQIAGTILAPGRNRGARKRKEIRGAYVGIRVGNDTDAQNWGLEKLTIEGVAKGRIK